MPLVRGKKRRSEPEEAEEASASASPEPETQRRRLSPADSAYGVEAANNASDSSELVKKMIRLALACEYQRRPIRRADIGEKVLGAGASRRFKEIFHAAQMELHSVFGIEMVELRGRERVTVAQKRAAAKSGTSQTTKPAASWILVSVLPSEFRDPEFLPPPPAPTSEEDSAYTSIYSLLISLITLNGGSLPDAKLTRYLRRLGIEDNTPMGAPGGGSEKTERLLKRLERDGYVVRVKETAGAGMEDDVYWTVGPRGKVEVGDEGVRGLVRSVYNVEDAEEEELERKIARSLGLNEGPVQNGNANGQASAGAKKRGRKRKDAVDEDDEEPVRRDEEDDDESDDD